MAVENRKSLLELLDEVHTKEMKEGLSREEVIRLSIRRLTEEGFITVAKDGTIHPTEKVEQEGHVIQSLFGDKVNLA